MSQLAGLWGSLFGQFGSQSPVREVIFGLIVMGWQCQSSLRTQQGRDTTLSHGTRPRRQDQAEGLGYPSWALPCRPGPLNNTTLHDRTPPGPGCYSRRLSSEDKRRLSRTQPFSRRASLRLSAFGGWGTAFRLP